MSRTSKPLLLLLLASAATAQTSPPTKPPAAQPPAQAASSVPTIQTRTNLVIEDVVVTDRLGNPVHGLLASDFALTEKGSAQQIRHFEEHIPTEAPPSRPEPPLPPGVFSNYAPPPASPALNVLLLDTLNTPLQSQANLRDQLLKYIRTAPPGNHIAIFGLSTRLYLLQGFSTDPAVLKAAIDKKSLRASNLLDNPTTGAPTEQLSDTLDDLAGGVSARASVASASALMKQFEADQASFEIQFRARYTLDAMNQLGRYLSSLPGRKNLIWFSGSFPLSVFPDANLSSPFNPAVNMTDDIRKTADLLTSSQVAVYPVDTRGLFNSPVFDASNSGNAYVNSPTRFARDQQKFAQQTASEHNTMYEVAFETGGAAFVNTNGLADALKKAINLGSNFYTLAYAPSDTRWNGDFRPITLKLVGRFESQALRLSYRRGYYADDPNASTLGNHPASAVAATATDPRRAMRLAMIHGAPTPTELIFKVLALPTAPATAQPETELAKNNVINPAIKPAHGPYRRYHISIAGFPSQLLTRMPDGTYVGDVEFTTTAYDNDGNLLTTNSETLRITLSAENFSRIARGSLPFQQSISVPTRGDLYLRIGVHNLLNDRVGALEFPLSAIAKLPPQPEPVATPPPAQPSQPSKPPPTP